MNKLAPFKYYYFIFFRIVCFKWVLKYVDVLRVYSWIFSISGFRLWAGTAFAGVFYKKVQAIQFFCRLFYCPAVSREPCRSVERPQGGDHYYVNLLIKEQNNYFNFLSGGNFFFCSSIILTVLSKSLSCLSLYSILFLLKFSYSASAIVLAIS